MSDPITRAQLNLTQARREVRAANIREEKAMTSLWAWQETAPRPFLDAETIKQRIIVAHADFIAAGAAARTARNNLAEAEALSNLERWEAKRLNCERWEVALA